MDDRQGSVFASFDAFVARLDAKLRERYPDVSFERSALPEQAVWRRGGLVGTLRPEGSSDVTLELGQDDGKSAVEPLTVPMRLNVADELARGDLTLFLGDATEDD